MSVLYGIHAVGEALKAHPERIERICVERGQKNPRIRETIDAARRKHVRISFEERSWLDRKSEGARHQGILCYASEITTFESDDIIEQAKFPGLLVVLDGVEDPHNLGAILRSAEAANADGVFLPQRRSAGLTAAAIKASAGAASHVRVARVSNISRLIDTLKEHKFWVVGLDAASDKPIWDLDLTIPAALVLGNEGTGLNRLVEEKCDFIASLPIKGNVGSYNVSVAAGIALYEVLRQRARKS
jgi:23S rRNA (guanosine2251-2'-O)-methyltransferase